jgi:hypothetical protein
MAIFYESLEQGTKDQLSYTSEQLISQKVFCFNIQSVFFEVSLVLYTFLNL